jgi:transcriptional regulator with XRE-family HTH domain
MMNGVYFREYRERADLTLRQVAERMGVSQTTIHKWENDQNSPSVRDLLKLAKIYGIPASAFFMIPNRPKRNDGICDPIRALAAVADIHPCAFVLIDGDFTRLDEAEQFTRLVRAYERLPSECREHLTKIGETYPAC